jgi:hypothetical protein
MSKEVVECKDAPNFIMTDFNTLKVFYDAISKIRNTLDSITNPKNYKNGFAGWNFPNPNFYRTSYNLILQTSYVKGDPNEVINYLYTPFGQVHLMSGGFKDTLMEISKEFMEKMNWVIEDCSDNIKMFYYYNVKHKKLYYQILPTESYEGAGDIVRFYLIKMVDDIYLPCDDDICVAINLLEHPDGGTLYNDDRERFVDMSKNTNQF